MSNNYEVAIIGGGIIGMATAYYLSKKGIKLAVIEKIHWLWFNRTLYRRHQATILKSHNRTFNETKHKTFFTNGRGVWI